MKKIEKVGEELELKLTMLKSDDEGQAGLIFSGPFPSCKDGKMVIYI